MNPTEPLSFQVCLNKSDMYTLYTPFAVVGSGAVIIQASSGELCDISSTDLSLTVETCVTSAASSSMAIGRFIELRSPVIKNVQATKCVRGA